MSLTNLESSRDEYAERTLAGKPIPEDSFLHQMDYLGFVHGDQRWRSEDGKRLFTWDSLHGEVEVFNGRGKHLFVADAVSGQLIGKAVRGRKIDV